MQYCCYWSVLQTLLRASSERWENTLWFGWSFNNLPNKINQPPSFLIEKLYEGHVLLCFFVNKNKDVYRMNIFLITWKSSSSHWFQFFFKLPPTSEYDSFEWRLTTECSQTSSHWLLNYPLPYLIRQSFHAVGEHKLNEREWRNIFSPRYA